MNIAEGLLPAFFALGVGFAAGKAHLVDNTRIGALNTIVMTIALPIALFAILAGADRDDVISHLAVAGAVAAVMAVVFASVYLLHRRAQVFAASAAVPALTVAFPNTAAIGFPLADATLGPTGALAVAVSLAVGGLTISPVTIAILEGSSRPRPTTHVVRARLKTFGKALLTPVVIAPFLGVMWSLAGIPFPELAVKTLGEVGGITSGLALIVTGLVLSAQPLGLTWSAAIDSVIANIGRPLLAVGFVLLVGMTGDMAKETVLLLAVPSGFFGVLLGLAHGADPASAGRTLFYSTLLSLVTVPATIAILPLL